MNSEIQTHWVQILVTSVNLTGEQIRPDARGYGQSTVAKLSKSSVCRIARHRFDAASTDICLSNRRGKGARQCVTGGRSYSENNNCKCLIFGKARGAARASTRLWTVILHISRVKVQWIAVVATQLHQSQD